MKQYFLICCFDVPAAHIIFEVFKNKAHWSPGQCLLYFQNKEVGHYSGEEVYTITKHQCTLHTTLPLSKTKQENISLSLLGRQRFLENCSQTHYLIRYCDTRNTPKIYFKTETKKYSTKFRITVQNKINTKCNSKYYRDAFPLRYGPPLTQSMF